jgi:RNA polymerase sigma factor (TIGR02999 family)
VNTAADDLTDLLNRPAAEGGGLDALMPLVHERLKLLARSQMGKHAPQPTLSATMLVNEVYLRLAQNEQQRWRDRQHFFATAATVLRRIIIDHARRKHAEKRGGSEQPLMLSALEADRRVELSESQAEDLVALDAALESLSRRDARAARVVECHVFGGYTFEETAESLRISPATAKRDWQFARAWLKRELGDGQGEASSDSS